MTKAVIRGLLGGVVALACGAVAPGPVFFGAAYAAPIEVGGGAASGPDAFLGTGTVSLSASKLPKWNGVRSTHKAQESAPAWTAMLAKARAGAGANLLQRVNLLVNQVPYVADPRDNWLTPARFFRDGGDCEDYAVAKFMLLRALGVPSSSMRILMIPRSPAAPGHSVLVVDTAAGAMVLDNRRSGLYPLSSDLASKASYAFNERTWWVSVGRRQTVARR